MKPMTSELAQIVGHLAELPDQLGVAELAGHWIPAAAEGDGADVAGLARERLGPHHGGVGAEAFRGFAWRDANDMAVTQRMRPDGRPIPPFRRIDWLFTRGVTASAPRTVAAVDANGSAISDHDALVVDLSL